MHRIDTPDAAAGLFKTTPAPATVVPPAWLNDVQETLLVAIEAAGITPVKGTWTELRDAIRRLGGGAPGNVAMHAGATPPEGWLECDGAAVSRATYAALFDAIGVVYGVGDGATTFNLPDMRGEFPRGWDNGRGVDAARALGSAQGQAIQSHNHSLPNQNSGSTGANSINITGGGGGPLTTGSTGGTETRPRNVALMFIIQAY